MARITMASVNFQSVQDDKASGSSAGLNNVQRSQFLANPEANVPIEAGVFCNEISSSPKLKVSLCNHSLWLEFSREQTEMILTKQGRLLFPNLVYKIDGMKPNAHYWVFLEIVPVDERRWRYENGEWSPQGKTENLAGNQLCIHPDSPNTGAFWMKKEITFEKLKVTNNKEAANNGNQMILLQSLHKYQPRLGIEEVWDGEHERPALPSTHIFTFPKTDFIAVTAYQNIKISQLKIKYNPFAAGFKEKRGRCLVSGDSTVMPTTFPETDPRGSLLEVGEGSHKAKERTRMNPGLLVQAAQPFQGYTYDSTPSSRNLQSLGTNGMEHDFLPFISLPTTHHNPRQDVVVPQGDCNYFCSSDSTKNSQGWLHSVPPVPMDCVTKAENEKQLEELTLRLDYNDSRLGEEDLKKRVLSLNDSGAEMYSRWKHRKYARCQESLEFCASRSSTENVSRGYTVNLEEDVCEVTDNMSLTPGVFHQVSKEPVNYTHDSVYGSNNLQPLGRNDMNPELLPSSCSPTMPFCPNQDVVDPARSWPTLSSVDSNMNNTLGAYGNSEWDGS